ncbi:hypothetical protein PMAYCL1PPCAC_16351 [Pristionchus mayeri]|uniref:Uncharacterized protein n=1 Tax=Pristionchus mayeri TaxID=1317129 RepID=A0AAN5HZR4_9BILA|nr:hypothetical protein PMAYCL1PPCAC_16351 [Pristionchus mayeri]
MKVLAIVALLVASAFASETHQKRQLLYSGLGYPVSYGLASYGYAAYPSYGLATVGYGYPAYGAHFIGKRSTDEHSRAKRQVLVGGYPAYGYGLSTGYGLASYGYGYPALSYGYPAYGGLVYGRK